MKGFPETKTVETAGGRIEYRDIGRGEPIVFFHGGQGNALNRTFDKTFDLDRYRLIIPSRPGYMRTALSPNATPADTAQLVHSLMDHLQTGPAALISVSLGARSAIEFSARYPRMTRSLVLSSAIIGPWMEPGDPRYLPARIFYNHRVEGITWAATRLAFSMFPRTSTRLFVNGLSTCKAGTITEPDAVLLRQKVCSLRSYRGFMSDIRHAVADEVTARVQCPTLIQHSLNDATVPVEHARHAQSLIPGAMLRLYDNAFGHFLWAGPGAAEAIRDVQSFVEDTNQQLLVAE